MNNNIRVRGTNISGEIAMFCKYYLSEFPCCLFHEFCHWVFMIPFWMLGVSTFPRLTISRYANWEINNTQSGHCIESHDMCINYNIPNIDKNPWTQWIIRIDCIMPAIGVILLFIFTPWWCWLFYIANMPQLWISINDYHIIIGKKNGREINNK
jgi:hypothetical protein